MGTIFVATLTNLIFTIIVIIFFVILLLLFAHPESFESGAAERG